MFHLVVKSPFDGYHVGLEITDPHEVRRILAGHNEAHVVRRAAPPVPPAAAEAAVETAVHGAARIVDDLVRRG